MDENLRDLTSNKVNDEQEAAVELSLRPQLLAEYIGQAALKEK